ncbi:carboxypeptidase-like regulatory domain-containing protein [Pontibacter litorisediminis]|uniref:carboxypeptidase-like regulatory domain-containing protein n=1 Tax=Pontibacter litorisediminis TaxID=1846260 RepID=UPI0023EDDDA3|nr:carboxypeptidase-like regulatory domain-containing protein [Pontibacter litorisediminis]
MKTRAPLYFVLLLLVCSLAACEPIKYDYISKYCPGSCTTIKGRISDQNGAPVAGVQLRASWHKPNYPLGGFTRHKAVATTDVNGNYELRFLLRDQELVEGYISLESEAELNAYLSCSVSNRWYGGEISRDTTVIQNYTITPSAMLKLHVTHTPEQPQFRAVVKYKLHPADPDSCTFAYDGSPGYFEDQVYVPANVPIVVYTDNMEAGITRKEVLTLQPNEVRGYTLEF